MVIILGSAYSPIISLIIPPLQGGGVLLMHTVVAAWADKMCPIEMFLEIQDRRPQIMAIPLPELRGAWCCGILSVMRGLVHKLYLLSAYV